MSRIRIGTPEAHEKLTARLFWKLSGESGYNDSGLVREYINASTRSLVTRSKSERGAKHVTTEQCDVNHEAYSFLLDERTSNQNRLIQLALVRPDSEQSEGEAVTSVIEGVTQGAWHDIGIFNLSNAAVTASVSGSLEEGIDYDVDSVNGRIFVNPGSRAGNGESLIVTADVPSVGMENIQTQQMPCFYCDIIIEEYNQFHKMWLRRKTFKAYLNVTEFPSQTGEFGTYRVKATAASSVIIQKRPEAPIPSPSRGVAGESSSSSSESSSSASSTSSLSYTSVSSSSSASSTSSLSYTSVSSSSSASSPSSSSTTSVSSASSASSASSDSSTTTSQTSLSSESSTSLTSNHSSHTTQSSTSYSS